MKHLKTLSGTFIPSAVCVLVEVGNRREVNTSAYLSHWFQGSCYELSLQISSLCCLQPTSNTITPPCTTPARSDISTTFWLIRLDSELANLIEDLLILNVRVCFSAHLFSGSNARARALREKKVAHVSPPVSVRLTISWHGGCNGAGQDRSGPLFVREWHLERARGHIWGMWAAASTGNKFRDWRLSVPTCL